MDKFYVLFHEYEFGRVDDIYDETKLIGVYSSEEKVNEAIEYYYSLPGFKDYPKECFEYSVYTINKNTEWIYGFVKISDNEDELGDEETSYEKSSIN